MITFECMQPIEEHARHVLEWRNDAAVREMSNRQEVKEWGSFYQEFLDEYFTHPEMPPLFIHVKGERAGYIRFRMKEDPLDKKRAMTEISIVVAPEKRDKGIGTAALGALKELFIKRHVFAVRADVKKENIASQMLFEKAGFRRVSYDGAMEHYVWTAPGKPLSRSPLFIIAEIGSNWKRGHLKKDWLAIQEMIARAKEAGVDAVKFQIFKAGRMYVANAGASDYLLKAGIQEDMVTLFQRLEMPDEWIPRLADECKKVEVELMASVFSEEDFEMMNPYVQRHKIASYEISYIPLIALAAQSKKPTFLSTGASVEEDIAWAVDAYEKAGGRDLTLLQCTAQYPASPSAMNVQVIERLKRRFGCSVGLSDHSQDPLVAPLLSVAYGATAIEKHYTLDRTLPGPDHLFAVEPHELKEMVRSIRLAEEMEGNGLKEVQPQEEELYYFARRGIQAIKSIEQGETFVLKENIAILRPGRQNLGIHPRYLTDIEGKQAKRAIQSGEGIQKGDF